MAKTIEFEEMTGVEDFPPPRPSRPLPVKVIGDMSVSCWELSEEEIVEIVRTKKIWVRTSQIRKSSFAPEGHVPEHEACQPAMSVNAFKHQILR